MPIRRLPLLGTQSSAIRRLISQTFRLLDPIFLPSKTYGARHIKRCRRRRQLSRKARHVFAPQSKLRFASRRILVCVKLLFLQAHRQNFVLSQKQELLFLQRFTRALSSIPFCSQKDCSRRAICRLQQTAQQGAPGCTRCARRRGKPQ